jgi:histone deacetylase complex regulatory component SIN3
MKDFKSGAMDTISTINSVNRIFNGDQNLMRKFAIFLPPGYESELIKATTDYVAPEMVSTRT